MTEEATSVAYIYTIALSQAEAEKLATGVVPKDVQDLVISLLIDAQASPAAALESMTRRARRNGGKPS